MKKMITLLAVAGMVLALAPAAQAALVSDPGGFTAPAGLNESDTYQLVFVSSTTRNATSNDIADYDTHVQNAANAAGIGTSVSVTWKAMASINVPLVHAQNHVSVTAPVYLVNGTKVASAGAFWRDPGDGIHDAPMNIDENGNSLVSNVWTGTNWEGWKNNGGLGASGGVNDPKQSVFALSDVTGQTWAGEAGLLVQTTSLPFYAVSQVLTVVNGGTPVPAGTVILFR
jgi:hypothetical protein